MPPERHKRWGLGTVVAALGLLGLLADLTVDLPEAVPKWFDWLASIGEWMREPLGAMARYGISVCLVVIGIRLMRQARMPPASNGESTATEQGPVLADVLHDLTFHQRQTLIEVVDSAHGSILLQKSSYTHGLRELGLIVETNREDNYHSVYRLEPSKAAEIRAYFSVEKNRTASPDLQ